MESLLYFLHNLGSHFMRLNYIVLLVFIAGSTFLIANPAGYVGRALPTSSGCGGGGCHASTKNAATTVSVDGVPSVTMQVGEVRQFTAIVAHASRPSAGIDIAVKTSATSQTNAGTLSAVSGQGLYVSGGELTHAAPKSMSGGKATFAFKWTAPTKAGTYYLCITGNAVNGNGREDQNDLWNFMTPIVITVEPKSTDVAELLQNITSTIAAPLPSANLVHVEFPCAPQERFEMVVMDIEGRRIFERTYTAEAESGHVEWDGDTSEGVPARSGVYMITLVSERRIIRAQAVIAR